MVPVWKDKSRLNVVFINKYKKRFLAVMKVCTALDI